MATKTYNSRIQWKKDTEANWIENNPVLLFGEIVVSVTDDGDRLKCGDGTSTFGQLNYLDQEIQDELIILSTQADTIQGNLTSHIGNTSNPHNVTAGQVGALPLDGGTMSGDINMGNNAISGLLSIGGDSSVDFATVLNLTSGLTTDGDINIDFRGCRIQGVNDPTTNTDAANKQYVDNAVSSAGGVNIAVQSSQPSGQSSGDFWYQIV